MFITGMESMQESFTTDVTHRSGQLTSSLSKAGMVNTIIVTPPNYHDFYDT